MCMYKCEGTLLLSMCLHMKSRVFFYSSASLTTAHTRKVSITEERSRLGAERREEERKDEIRRQNRQHMRDRRNQERQALGEERVLLPRNVQWEDECGPKPSGTLSAGSATMQGSSHLDSQSSGQIVTAGLQMTFQGEFLEWEYA